MMDNESPILFFPPSTGGGGSGAPTTAKYITQTPDSGLSAEQALSALATGMLKNTTTTGVLSIGVNGTDYVAGNGSTMTGLLILSGDPATGLGAATKQYVDAVAQGLDMKPSCKCSTTANITRSGEQTLDGVLTSASRVLVKNQTDPKENGIYVSGAGAWVRSTDMDDWLEVPGAFTFIEQGTLYGDTGWVCTSDVGGTIGSTNMVWGQFSGAGTYTAGTGLLLTGTQLSIDPSGTPRMAKLGLGIAADAGAILLKLQANAAAPPTAQTGTLIQLTQVDSTIARVELNAFASQSFFSARRANGTNGSPTNLVADDQIGGFIFSGYGATGYGVASATFRGFSAGTWSDTSLPTYLEMATCPAASTTMVARMRIESNGGVTVNARLGVGATADATNLVTVTLGTITAQTLPINITGTWNNGAVVFTGLTQDITNTASDVTSRLFDFKVGGTTAIHGLATGQIRGLLATAALPTFSFTGRTSNGMYSAGNGIIGFAAAGVQMASISATGITAMLALNISASPFTTADVILSRSAANALEMINGTATQTFRVNGPFTDASNFVALSIIGNTINTEVTGTGFPRTTSAPILNLSQTWNAAGVTFTAFKCNVTSTASAAGSFLIDLQTGGTTQFNVIKTGTATIAADLVTGGTSSLYGTFGTSMRQEAQIAWTNSTAFNGTKDLLLNRDAAGILAQRNSTSAQAFRIYNTFTTVETVGEWFTIDWQTSSNVCSLWTKKGSSTGTARNLVLGTDATVRITIGATTGTVTLSADQVFSTVGKGFTLTSGTGQRGGTALLVGGTVTVTNTNITANSVIQLTVKVAGGTLGGLTYTLSAGASFTINSSSAIDTSTIAYLIYEVV